MAYNTKAIKLDVNGKPVPQYYNPVTDEYEVLQGVSGATRHVLYGADGNPISTTGNKLAVRATEIETLLESLDDKDFATQTTLAAVLAKLSADPATQTTLAAILAKIIAAPSTEAKQDTIIGHVDGIEGALTTLNGKDFATQTTLAAILAKIIAAPSTEAKQDTIIGHVDGIEGALTTLNGKDFATQTTLAAILAKITAAPATEAKQDALAGLIGALNAAAVTDPASTTAVLIALVKGLLKQMQGGGSGNMPVTLSGSKMELYGVAIEDRPDANTVAVGATFTIVDDTGNFDSYISNGTDWLEV